MTLQILKYVIEMERQDYHITAWKIHTTALKWAAIYHQDLADAFKQKLEAFN